jgi:hypothetical protein
VKYLLSPDKNHAILLDRIVGFDIVSMSSMYSIHVRYKDYTGTQQSVFVDKIMDRVDAQAILEGLINKLNKTEPEGRSLDDTRKVNINA